MEQKYQKRSRGRVATMAALVIALASAAWIVSTPA
jgi:hypothetical protein